MARNIALVRNTVLLIFFLIAASFGFPPKANAGVEFSFSSDPDDVVLSVTTLPAMQGYRTTMTLYGDGRVTIAKKYTSGKVVEDSELRLDLHEMTAILQGAVDSGLVEYETRAMLERQRQSLRGRVYVPMDDDTLIRIRISLKGYRQDGNQPVDVTNELETSGVRLQQDVYGFPEYQGILDLCQAIGDLSKRARGVTH